jgi:hypothetical protein
MNTAHAMQNIQQLDLNQEFLTSTIEFGHY